MSKVEFVFYFVWIPSVKCSTRNPTDMNIMEYVATFWLYIKYEIFYPEKVIWSCLKIISPFTSGFLECIVRMNAYIEMSSIQCNFRYTSCLYFCQDILLVPGHIYMHHAPLTLGVYAYKLLFFPICYIGI